MGRSKLIPFAHYAAVLAVGLATAGVAQAQSDPHSAVESAAAAYAATASHSGSADLRRVRSKRCVTSSRDLCRPLGYREEKSSMLLRFPHRMQRRGCFTFQPFNLQKLTAGAWFVPRAEWGTGDLQTACKEGYAKGVVGGIVLEATVGTTGTENYFFVQRGWATVQGLAEVWACGPGDPRILAPPAVVAGFGNSTGASLFPESGLATWWMVNPEAIARSLALTASLFSSATSVTVPAINAQSNLNKSVTDFASTLLVTLRETICKLDIGCPKR